MISIQDRPPLTVNDILKLADRHKKLAGRWPNKSSGNANSRGDTWMHFDHCLRRGKRGLPSGLSLAQLLSKHQGVRNHLAAPRLTYEQILARADAHFTAPGSWPNSKSGVIPGTEETWKKIDANVMKQGRGLPYSTTLARLLFDQRGVPMRGILPRLSNSMIIRWAKAHKRDTGAWPYVRSGAIAGTEGSWAAVNNALSQGHLGLPGGSSLAHLLEEYCRGKSSAIA